MVCSVFGEISNAININLPLSLKNTLVVHFPVYNQSVLVIPTMSTPLDGEHHLEASRIEWQKNW